MKAILTVIVYLGFVVALGIVSAVTATRGAEVDVLDDER